MSSRTVTAEDLRKRAVVIVPDRLFHVALRQCPVETSTSHFFSIDNTLVYWNFFLDFGPLSLAQLYQFCKILNMKLQDPALRSKKIYFYSSHNPHKRANAAALMACYAVIYLGRTPEEAYRPFAVASPKFTPFHDASQYECTFKLTVMDCARAVYKAKRCELFNFDTFNLRECMYYEQVEHGDLNWILPNMCAFAGPQETREAGLLDGYSCLVPEDYVEYFKQRDVKVLMRLNKKYYNAERFEEHGIHVVDLYYRDGGVPTMELLQRFLSACEGATTSIGVHCKAGLGRTGTCMGAYMQKHYKFTAAEAIAWIRICRPGSIIGPQQHFLELIEEQMWREGDEFRARLRAGKSTISASLSAALSGLHMGTPAEVELSALDGEATVLPTTVATGSSSSSSSSSSGRATSSTPSSVSPKPICVVTDAHDRSNQAAALLSRRSPTSKTSSPLAADGAAVDAARVGGFTVPLNVR
jgi:cell division cycle 14